MKMPSGEIDIQAIRHSDRITVRPGGVVVIERTPDMGLQGYAHLCDSNAKHASFVAGIADEQYCGIAVVTYDPKKSFAEQKEAIDGVINRLEAHVEKPQKYYLAGIPARERDHEVLTYAQRDLLDVNSAYTSLHAEYNGLPVEKIQVVLNGKGFRSIVHTERGAEDESRHTIDYDDCKPNEFVYYAPVFEHAPQYS